LTLFALAAPTRVQSQIQPQNSAACAVDWFDALAQTMHLAEDIIGAMGTCDPVKTQTVKSRGKCTKVVFGFMKRALSMTKVGQGVAFDCFGQREPCSQMIVGAFKGLIDAASSLTSSVLKCTPETKGKLSPRAGFGCYKTLWSTLKKIMSMVMHIDKATKTCVPAAKVPSLAAAPADVDAGAAE